MRRVKTYLDWELFTKTLTYCDIREIYEPEILGRPRSGDDSRISCDFPYKTLDGETFTKIKFIFFYRNKGGWGKG